MLAPIVIFAFNRYHTLEKTIDSIKSNPLAKNSDLFIFVDGPKNKIDIPKVNKVHNIVKSITGFKNIEYFFSDKNKGLANSIISGSTKVLKKYGKIIVIEDDLYVSPSFLYFMNQMLDKYEKVEKVFQVSGYGVKIKNIKDYPYDAYFYIRAHCWTWGTWNDRWNTIDWNVSSFDDLTTNKKKRKEFNKGGSDLYGMLKGYMIGKNDSWYIRFTYSMFEQKKLAVMPIRSLVINNGFIKEATHCNTYNRYKVDFFNGTKRIFSIPNLIQIDPFISKQVYYYWGIPYRIYGKIMGYIQNMKK